MDCDRLRSLFLTTALARTRRRGAAGCVGSCSNRGGQVSTVDASSRRARWVPGASLEWLAVAKDGEEWE